MSSTKDPSSWQLEVRGRKLALVDDRCLIVGRDPGCDLPVSDERVSWRHLQIEIDKGAPLLTDLGSRNGTFIDGKRVDSQPTPITHECIIQIGSTRARLREPTDKPSATRPRFRRAPVDRRPVRIGRAPDNDVVLDEPNVSWHHAELRPGSPPTLVDLKSRNGVRLGNQWLHRSGALQPGIAAGIGPFSLRFENDELVVIDERGGHSLSAQLVSVRADGIQILNPTSLGVAPGEFVSLIGPSGSGKTTLLKCLAGVSEPSAGQVLVGNDPLELRETEVGYVPQSDVVHDRLTVREALFYAARLRLPSDTRPEEHAAAVDEVLDDLRLLEHQDTRIGQLSGGQRKRVACGVELIGKPTMLLLDEPTSGLDPPLERRLMMTFRHLADIGRGIVVVTHATSSLSLCDTVAVMAPGGHLLLASSPRESLEHFQVSAYDEIYDAIELAEVPPVSEEAPAPREPHARARFLSGRSFLSHTVTLTARYARTMLRDRRTLAILLGQAPVIALLIDLLYPANVLALPDRSPTKSAQFVFLLVTGAVWLGLIDACREIVKERSIITRELAVGVRLDAYVFAKAIILFALAIVQCLLLVTVATLLQHLHSDASAYFELIGLLILTSWSAIGVGLVVSSLARGVDQASSLIPLLLLPQLLFGGALQPFAKMQAVPQAIADVVVSRWAFAGAGHTIQMNARLTPKRATSTGFGTDFFSLDEGVCAVILLGFTAAMLLTVAVLLTSRRET